MNKEKTPKILLIDIETAPNLGYIWGKYEQNVIDYKTEWYLLSFCAKWLGEKKMISYKLNDFKLFKKDKENDFELIRKLWDLLDEADIIIGHNSDEFDIKKTNARFLFHHLRPPTPYKTLDTKKIAKKYFNFNSNKLDDLGRYLGIGRKMEHEGFSLWLKCMAGDESAWNRMIRYNKQDVILLEKLYKRFLPYITNHPNYGLYQQKEFACPNCGSYHLHKRGYAMTKTNMYNRWQCQECGSWSQSVKCEKKIKPQVKN